jgi:hypothetical protein
MPFARSSRECSGGRHLAGQEQRQATIVSGDDEFIEVKEEPAKIKVTAKKKPMATHDEATAEPMRLS